MENSDPPLVPSPHISHPLLFLSALSLLPVFTPPSVVAPQSAAVSLLTLIIVVSPYSALSL